MCDTQNNIIVDHIKNDANKVTIICLTTKDKEAIASLMRAPKMQVVMEILNSN